MEILLLAEVFLWSRMLIMMQLVSWRRAIVAPLVSIDFGCWPQHIHLSLPISTCALLF